LETRTSSFYQGYKSFTYNCSTLYFELLSKIQKEVTVKRQLHHSSK